MFFTAISSLFKTLKDQEPVNLAKNCSNAESEIEIKNEELFIKKEDLGLINAKSLEASECSNESMFKKSTILNF